MNNANIEIKELVKISNEIGKFKDLVQAGGGNTSIKTNDGKMLIKASGFSFSEMTPEKGFVTLDLNKIEKFFEKNHSNLTSEEKETEYNKILAESTIEKSETRPSMEAGMHAFLGKVVIHTHPAMVNILTCIKGGKERAGKLFSEANPPILWIDYVNPGYNLAAEVGKKVGEYQKTNGKTPTIIFLKNHGLIISGNDAEECMKKTFEVNGKIKKYFDNDNKIDGYPDMKLQQKPGFFLSNNEIVMKFLELLPQNKSWLSQFLIPDDVIYCKQDFAIAESENNLDKNKINIIKGNGIFYPWNEKKSAKVDEVLTAKLFVLLAIDKMGEPEFLKEEDVDYLISMDSEKYRQSLDKSSGVQ